MNSVVKFLIIVTVGSLILAWLCSCAKVQKSQMGHETILNGNGHTIAAGAMIRF